jgi:cystathionine beta-lyase/cystathionine gamma-synthase
VVAPEVLAVHGIGPGTLRLSVGLEDVEDLWADLQRGLEAAAAIAEPQPRAAA